LELPANNIMVVSLNINLGSVVGQKGNVYIPNY
jgi:hypothetical protein